MVYHTKLEITVSSRVLAVLEQLAHDMNQNPKKYAEDVGHLSRGTYWTPITVLELMAQIVCEEFEDDAG